MAPDEAKLVEKVVNDVSSKLNSTTSNDFEDMVGIKSHMKNMNSLLNLESEEVIMVGVWGLCGVGKTTIGRALFSQLSCQFQGSIFIDKTKKNLTRAKSDDYNTQLCSADVHSIKTLHLMLATEAVKLVGNLPLCLNFLGSSLEGVKKEEWADRGTKSVLGIFLNLSEMKDTLCFGEEVFEGMTNLRFLRIYGISQEDKEIGLEFRHLNLSTLKWWDGSRKPLKEGKYYMGRQLRLLEWWGYPMWRLPSYICAENLVELIMPDSRLTMLWTGVQLLNNLKKIDLRRSKKLNELPNLSTATNLEELYLEDCWSLWKITSSIRYLKKLRKLDMKRCKELLLLPTDIDLESLHSLNLSGCSKLESFPHISRNISNLVLDETKIEEVPERIEDISGLNYILMTGFSNLKYFSSNISKLKHFEMICSFLHGIVYSIFIVPIPIIFLAIRDPETAVSQMLADDISFSPKELFDMETLKEEFNGLEWKEKVLFCHIACFFNNETYENVTQLLKDCGFDVGGSLEILYEKSLIQISVERVIIMRPVLQKIGRDEVLAEFINVPANRQFLMDTEGCDLLIDLTDDTKRMYGISFNISEMEQRLARDERLKGMKRLKVMRMYKDSLYGQEVRVNLLK
ncbi:hypothetical protein HID58_059449 [Brassica napus]|uniref:Disease resistance protein Roq1-like winged-helix domain-containing protein n=1 Tax=Brassica napus TaxID=3708 RepID=A0ABQ7ZT18_BRANA|nr:hypothetical protein HID58_059449 [Brassica napus]